MQQAYFIKKPKEALRVWLDWAQHQVKNHKLFDYAENSKESLFMGKLSDGSRDPKSLKPVPRGFFTVYVGQELRRFVIPMDYLHMPDFRVLMDSVAQEYGYGQEGAIEIPCEEGEFEEILLRCLQRHQMMSKARKGR